MMTLRFLGCLRVLLVVVMGMGGLSAAETAKTVPMAAGTYRVKVEALRVDGRSYSVTLKGSDSKANISTRSSVSSRADDDTLKFLGHLKEGGEYDFPKVFEDVFGKDYASAHANVVREFGFASNPSVFPAGLFGTPPPQVVVPVARPTNLFELGTVPKFKAVVTGKTLDTVLVIVTLETNYGETLELKHGPGTTDADVRRFELARSMVSQMEKGKEYEFPEVVEHPERIAAPAAEVPQPTAEMKALEAFIGEWVVTRDGDDNYKGTVSCSWSSDGTGLWRESKTGSGAKDRLASRWSYDTTAKCYVENGCNPKSTPGRIRMEWDAASKSMTFSEEFSVGGGKRSLKGSRSFESADRIRWKTTSTGPDGVPHDLSGYYSRVKK